jgi:hypothetical protein
VENAEGKRLIEWIEENGWEVLNGNKQGDEREMDLYRWQGGNSDRLRKSERRALERVEEFRIGERVESDHLEIALRKRRGGKEQIRRGVGDTNEKGYFGNFWGCYFMFGYDYVHCH